MESHSEFLNRVSLDEKLSTELRSDYKKADLTKEDQVMLEYTEKVTLHAWKVTPEDLDRLRKVGFDDRGILQINLIASWFNYINRVADGLGVGRWQNEHSDSN